MHKNQPKANVLPIWFEIPYREYLADDEFAAYGAISNPFSAVGNSTIFVNLLQRVSEKRFKSLTKYNLNKSQKKKWHDFVYTYEWLNILENVV